MRTQEGSNLTAQIAVSLTTAVAVLMAGACSSTSEDAEPAPRPTTTETAEPTEEPTVVASPTPAPAATTAPIKTGVESFPETDALVGVSTEPAPELFCKGFVSGTAEAPAGGWPELQTLGAEIERYTASFEDNKLPWTGYVLHLDQDPGPHIGAEAAVATWSDRDGRVLVTTLLLDSDPDVEQWLLGTVAYCPSLLDPLRNEDGTFDTTEAADATE